MTNEALEQSIKQITAILRQQAAINQQLLDATQALLTEMRENNQT